MEAIKQTHYKGHRVTKLFAWWINKKWQWFGRL